MAHGFRALLLSLTLALPLALTLALTLALPLALTLALTLTLAAVSPLSAGQPLAPPGGRVLLTVDGAVDHGDARGRVRFDRAMLEAIGLARVSTSTSWTEGAPEFEGVLARDVLHAAGASGTVVTATALNDYSVDIPIADFENYTVLLALRMNGTELTARDKGPVWVVYPRDTHPELQNQKADAKWIWQLVKLTVR